MTQSALPAPLLHDTSMLKARFGSHWSGLSSDHGVREYLEDKREPDWGRFATPDEAVAYARSKRAERLATIGRDAERRLNYLENRVRIFRARWGLIKDADTIKLAEAQHREKVAAWKQGTDDWSPDIHPLPDHLRGPVLLKEGQEVWLVTASWPLTSGVHLQRLHITSVSLYAFEDDERDYDISFNYTAKPLEGEKGREFDFSYKHSEIGSQPVGNNLMDNWGFLDLVSARAKLAEITTRLRQVADEGDRQAASLDAAPTSGPD